MKVIVISAHPDDLEIACSGTLAKLQAQGAEIISVITVAPSEEINTNRSKDIVQAELDTSYSISGFKLRVLDTQLHPNGRPNLTCDNNTITQLSNLLEPCDIAIIPNPQDWHQDHKTTYEIAWPLVQRLAKEVWLLNSWPYCLKYASNDANLFQNTSDYWDFKQKLLSCYTSYITPKNIEDIKLVDQYNSLRLQTNLAEAFTLVQKHVD